MTALLRDRFMSVYFKATLKSHNLRHYCFHDFHKTTAVTQTSWCVQKWRKTNAANFVADALRLRTTKLSICGFVLAEAAAASLYSCDWHSRLAAVLVGTPRTITEQCIRGRRTNTCFCKFIAWVFFRLSNDSLVETGKPTVGYASLNVCSSCVDTM